MYSVVATVQPEHYVYPVDYISGESRGTYTDATLRTGRSTVLAQWSDAGLAFRHVERLLAQVQPVGVLFTYTVRDSGIDGTDPFTILD